MSKLVPIERIESKIYMIRGQKVMLDIDLAGLYEVETKQLKRQVKRNPKRFPDDFMFQLSRKEYTRLRCQFGTLRWGQHAKYLPYAFTEHGILMLSSVLNSERALQVNIMIMRAFTRLRRIMARNKDLSYLFKELKHKVGQHDVEIGLIIKAIEKMIYTDKPVKGEIGFRAEKEGK
jgi:hypothetical protein